MYIVCLAMLPKLLLQMYAKRLSKLVSPNSGIKSDDSKKKITYLMKLDLCLSDFNLKLRFIEVIHITYGNMM